MNITGFLKQTSEPEYIFKWDSDKSDYYFIKGNLKGQYIKDLLINYKDELKELLQELYDECNYHTKLILKDIVKENKKYFLKKILKN